MDFPEIEYNTSLESTQWRSGDSCLPVVKYINHLTSYEDLFKHILMKNQLCIIGPHATHDWASRRFWVMPDGSPNISYLQETFGESVAPVADCNSEEFCAHSKTEMTVKEYLTYWQNCRSQGHCQDTRCLYLKDWHFVRDYPGYYGYQTPSFLCSDWMNEFWDVRKDQEKTDDYRFVYMGPKHSWTPFHADVLYSYSWSANICGKKKWIFYPPGEERNLKDKHGQLVFDLRSPDLQDLQKYPDARSADGTAITVIQNPGEIIFVPSGWHHQVFNLEDTISINHNWMNGCGAHLSWDYIKRRLAAVQKEIEDCKDMEGWHHQCQVILKADSGMDYISFYNFMATIAAHRMNVLNLYLKGDRSTGIAGFSHFLEFASSSSSSMCKFKKHDGVGGKLTVYDCSNCVNETKKVQISDKLSCLGIISSCDKDSLVHLSGFDKAVVGNRSGCGKDIHENISEWDNIFGNTLGCDKDVLRNISECDKDGRENISECDKDGFENISECDKDGLGNISECDKIGLENISECDNDGLENISECDKDGLENISGCAKDSLENISECDKDGLENISGRAKDSLENISECDKNGLGNISGCDKNVGRNICLCLFKGILIDTSKDGGDIMEHQECPHWAHCGPNLAIFDLCRVLDIVQDMMEQVEFKVIMDDRNSQGQFVISPSELVRQVGLLVSPRKSERV